MSDSTSSAPALPPLDPLSPGSPVPLYHQLYLQIRQKILDGELPYGARLAGEHELLGQYGVSRITSRRAMAELARDGFIERGRGRGSYVIHRRTTRPLQGTFGAAVDNLIAFGRATEVRLLSFERLPAPDAMAGQFGLAPGAKLVRVVRVRRDEDVPFAHLESWTRPLGARYSRAALANGLRLELFRQCGVDIARFEQSISASAAPADVAAALQVSAGEPLLAIQRLSYDADNCLVDRLRALYRPDRFQLTMSLGDAATAPEPQP